MNIQANQILKKVKNIFRSKYLVYILAIVLLALSLSFRLYDWQGRSGGFYGDKARDIFVSGMIAEGQSILVGHSASGLSSPYVHYPPYYYIFLSLFWKIGKNPFNVLLLMGIWHSIWVVFFFLFVYRVKKDLKLATLIGFWYATAHLWVSATYEIVGVWVAYPLFFTWLLTWYGYEETKKLKYLVACGFVAAITALFHYSIVPAVVAQFITIFFFGIFSKKDRVIRINHSLLLLFSFSFSFVIVHISQFRFYGIQNVLHSWLYSGNKIVFFDFFNNIATIFGSQLDLLLLPNNSSLVAKIFISFVSIFVIIGGRAERKILTYLIIFTLLASTKNFYVAPFFTPGRIALSLLTLLALFRSIFFWKKSFLKIFSSIFLIYFLVLTNSYNSVQWKNNEISQYRSITHFVFDKFPNKEIRIYSFDEDSLGWDTPIMALWLWFDYKKNWFSSSDLLYNYNYTIPKDTTILFCSRRNGKSCTEFWDQFMEREGYGHFQIKQYTIICDHESLILCREECPEVLTSLATIQECDIK